MNRLREQYQKEIVKKLKEEFKYTNDMEVPTLTKIVINSGMGSEVTTNPSSLDVMFEDIKTISGQQPIKTRSTKAISNFKIRKNLEIGIKVTLRKERMWDFYDKLVNIVLPRVRDFRGVERKFDGHGNYSLGITEHIVFPEIDTTKIDKLRGLQIIINTSAQSDKEAEKLLELLGMPFKKAK